VTASVRTPGPQRMTRWTTLGAAAARHAAPIVLLCLIAAWLAFKSSALAHRFGDGHMYTYMGFLVADGALPYRDFYYSSPPLLPYLFAVIGTLVGWTTMVPDALPLALTALDALLVYALVTKLAAGTDRADGGSGGAARTSGAVGITAVASAAILLGSYINLTVADFSTDAHWITALMLAAMLAAAHSRWAWVGLALALALLTKLYAVFIVAGSVGALLLARQVRPALLVGAWAAGVFLAVMALITAVVGKPVIEQVLLNNLGRTPHQENRLILELFATRELWALPAAALLATGLLRRPALWPCLVPIALYLGFIASYSDVYLIYMQPLIAYLTVVTAVVSLQTRRSGTRIALAWAATAAVSGAFGLHNYLATERHRERIDDLDTIVAAIRELGGPDDTLYGDNYITPLVALHADRRIFHNHVDTNPKFVMQGLVDLEERAREAEAGGMTWLLVRARGDGRGNYWLKTMLPQPFIDRRCVVEKLFLVRHAYSEGTLFLYRCG